MTDQERIEKAIRDKVGAPFGSKNRLGKKHSKSTRLKMRMAWIRRKEKGLGIAWNKGLKKWWKSPGDFKKGHIPWVKGKKASEETRDKQSEAHKKLTGENSNNWKGGISKKRGYGNFYKLRYKARKKGADGYHTSGEWETLKAQLLQAQNNWHCNICGKSEPEIQLTEDHIVPLSKGGSDNIENIQPLCKSCNSRKGIKTINFKYAN